MRGELINNNISRYLKRISTILLSFNPHCFSKSYEFRAMNMPSQKQTEGYHNKMNNCDIRW